VQSGEVQLGEVQSDASAHDSLEGLHFDEMNSSAPWNRLISISLYLEATASNTPTKAHISKD